MELCRVVFTLIKELDKSILVRKDSKKFKAKYFIPKSLIQDRRDYQQRKSFFGVVDYHRNRIELLLPKWYCEKELGFYR